MFDTGTAEPARWQKRVSAAYTDLSPLPGTLLVLLLFLQLSLLFQAFLWGLLIFLYPFTFLFHDTLLSLSFS